MTSQHEPIDNGSVWMLISINNPEQKFVLLDKVPMILGRMEVIGNKDTRLSKEQMQFEAEYSKSRVIVEQLGTNRSAVNNEPMMKGEKRFMYDRDKVSLLVSGNDNYRLCFLSLSVESNKRLKSCANQDNIKPKKPRLNFEIKWENIDGSLLVYNSANLVHKNKIAAFDLDGTLIVTQWGESETVPIDHNDWKLRFPLNVNNIQQLSDDGYKIVIFADLGDIEKKTVNEESLKQLVENVIDAIKTPIQVFVATQLSIYTKPAPGMWDTLVSKYNGDILIDKCASFYCGDAAGRPEQNDRNGQQVAKKDHSSCDRLFAWNIDLKFYTPEEYFWKKPKEKFTFPIFDPRKLTTMLYQTDYTDAWCSHKKEVIIIVGCPNSGKTYFTDVMKSCTFSSDMLLKIISRDELGSLEICVDKAYHFLQYPYFSVVIDDRNPDVESRKRFIEIAQKLKLPCRVYLMNVSKDLAKHINRFLKITGRKHNVTDSMIDTYFEKFKEPSLSEGIDQITEVRFAPNFENYKEDKLYQMFLL